jgi:GT2 family glycosyltransferase
MGWHKSDLLALNGFDTDYQNPGFGEDVDIEWRALKLGLKSYSMRFKAIQYHLEHTRPNRSNLVEIGRKMLDEKIKIGLARCINGLG